jgi:hypothetical protein
MERQTFTDRSIALVLREIRLREAEQARASYQEELDRQDENLTAWYASRTGRSPRGSTFTGR